MSLWLLSQWKRPKPRYENKVFGSYAFMEACYRCSHITLSFSAAISLIKQRCDISHLFRPARMTIIVIVLPGTLNVGRVCKSDPSKYGTPDSYLFFPRVRAGVVCLRAWRSRRFSVWPALPRNQKHTDRRRFLSRSLYNAYLSTRRHCENL